MYASQLSSPNLRNENKALDSVQRKFTKRLIGGQGKTIYGERLQQFDLLSLESRRSEQDMLTVFKLIYGLQDVSLEDAGLSLSKSNTRGGCVRLLRDHIENMTTSMLFKFRVQQL